MATQYNGVSQAGDKYRAQINRKGKVFYLGTFDDIRVAAEFVDHALLATRAWGRACKLNWGTTQELPEEHWPEAIANMVNWLRLNFAEDENNLIRSERVLEYTPDVTLESFEVISRKLRDVADQVSTVLEEGKGALRRAAQQMEEDKRVKDWQRDRIVELEDQLRRRKDVEAKGYTFKKIDENYVAPTAAAYDESGASVPLHVEEPAAPAAVVNAEPNAPDQPAQS